MLEKYKFRVLDESISRLCVGVTKKGSPCKNRILKGSDYIYCFSHKEQEKVVVAANILVEKTGNCKECSKPISPNYKYCFAHRALEFTRVCKGKTAEGLACSVAIKPPYKYCLGHQEQQIEENNLKRLAAIEKKRMEGKVRCLGLTEKKQRCKILVKCEEYSDYCSLHKGDEKKLFEEQGKQWPPVRPWKPAPERLPEVKEEPIFEIRWE